MISARTIAGKKIDNVGAAADARQFVVAHETRRKP